LLFCKLKEAPESAIDKLPELFTGSCVGADESVPAKRVTDCLTVSKEAKSRPRLKVEGAENPLPPFTIWLDLGGDSRDVKTNRVEDGVDDSKLKSLLSIGGGITLFSISRKV
jgi:hypothetical protein